MSFKIEIDVMDRGAGETPRPDEKVIAFIDIDKHGPAPGVVVAGQTLIDQPDYRNYRYWISITDVAAEVSI